MKDLDPQRHFLLSRIYERGFPVSFKKNILLLISSGLSLLVINQIFAAPPFDLDYELHVGVEETRYEIWIDPPDGEPQMHSVYYTHHDASYQLFRLVEAGSIQPATDAWIQPGTYTRWVYWNTYEELDPALEIADAFEFAGLETKITPVFGGYYPTLKWWEFSGVELDTSDQSHLLEDENRRFDDLQESETADRK